MNDKDFDWKSLGKAIDYCLTTWHRWGRMHSNGKEKYGTFRATADLWDGTVYRLFNPGYMYIKSGFWWVWYFYVDRPLSKKFFKYTGILKLFNWYQAQVYNYSVQKVCKKYPHIVDEIVSDLDDYELVKPSVFGKIDGKTIHDKYWKQNKDYL